MKLSGTLISWEDERGFGFIAPAHGGAKVFLHISELPKDGTRPAVGERLTYELGRGKNGKPQAVHVVRQAFGDTRNNTIRTPSIKGHRPRAFTRAICLLVLLALGVFAYQRYQQKIAPSSVAPVAAPFATPNKLPVEVQQVPLQNSNPSGFTCDGRTHCSQMTSCAEAKFFLNSCPNTEMDGNHDGVPCQQQWCTSPLAK